MSMTEDFFLRSDISRAALLDELGGLATAIIALLGLLGVNGPLMAVTATIAFGATWMIYGTDLLTGLGRFRLHEFSIVNLSPISLSGTAAVVIGVLAFLGVGSAVLTPIAAITLGAAMILSNDPLTRLRNTLQSREEALDLRNIHMFAGIAVVILGSLSASGGANDLDLNLVALFILGVASLVTGRAVLAAAQNLLQRRRR